MEFTRSRPYRENDQAHVEQKNGAVVRRMVGYRRYAGVDAATELARLYRSMRLFVKFFQPSFRLMDKTRDGARVTKRYHAPLPPFQSVQAHPAVSRSTRDALAAQFAQLDPVALLHDVRQAQARLAALADATPRPETATDRTAETTCSSRGFATRGTRARHGQRRAGNPLRREGGGGPTRSRR